MRTVSIAMATYNGTRFIAQQLESFTRQTVLPSELVITDDCSTDDTLALIAAFAARAPFPVRVERNAKQLGFRANFMKAAGLCQSEFIAFADQDDVWLPDKLETCLAAFTDDDILLAYHNLTVVSGELRPLGTFDRSGAPQAVNPPNSIDPSLFILGMTLVVRSHLRRFSGYWPEASNIFDASELEAHDQWFFFLASCMGSIAYITKPLALYRRHGENTTVWGGNLGVPSRIDNLKATDLPSLRSREISAGKRAYILERLQNELAEPQKARVKAAAIGYRKFETSYRLRQKLYTSGNIFSRTRQLIASLCAGVYLPRTQWGSGRKAFVRDIVRGVILPVKTTSRRDSTTHCTSVVRH
jgi:glycosyltransferase involved in cell wall biosynthesis